MEPRVRDAMSTSDVQFDEGHLLADALEDMQRRGVGTAPVVSADGSLKGVLVRRDAGRALRRSGAGSSTVGEVCRSGVSVGVDDSLQAALRVLEAEEVGQIPAGCCASASGAGCRSGATWAWTSHRRTPST